MVQINKLIFDSLLTNLVRLVESQERYRFVENQNKETKEMISVFLTINFGIVYEKNG